MKSSRWYTFLVNLKWWYWLLIFCVLSLLLYAPILGNSFLNDDFLVIKKVCKDGKLNINGFFRPLSDITLFLNYKLTGLNPVSYYLTNILLHGLNTFMLFQFCRLWKWTPDEKRQWQCALLAAALFVTYPFHIEPVVWILGRASLSASTFGIMALVIMVSDWKEPWKLAGVAICFFIAMAGYESVMVLPALIFIWLWNKKASVHRYFLWMTVMVGTLAVHFVLRALASGSVVGEYGAAQFDFPLSGLILKVFKTIGRFIWPPLQHAYLIAALYVVGLIIFTVVILKVWGRVKREKDAPGFLTSQVIFFLTASLIPFVFGVSTHTSESDRFLYFPSFFFCVLVAFIISTYSNQKSSMRWIIALILFYQLICLQWSLVHWRKASGAVKELLSMVDRYSVKGKVYVANLPEEVEGAYVFRNGFRDALLLYNLDTSSVVVLNRASRDELLKWPGKIKPVEDTTSLFIPPAVRLRKDQQQHLFLAVAKDPEHEMDLQAGTLLFWNKEDWVVLQLGQGD